MNRALSARPQSTIPGLRWTLLILVVGFATPTLIMLSLDIFIGGLLHPNLFVDFLLRPTSLLLLSMTGAIPFVPLAAFLSIFARRLPPARLACIVLGGLSGILSLMVPAHISVWLPLYNGSHMRSTAVIAFVFIPWYCLASLGFGMAVGWLASRLPWFYDPPIESI